MTDNRVFAAGILFIIGFIVSVAGSNAAASIDEITGLISTFLFLLSLIALPKELFSSKINKFRKVFIPAVAVLWTYTLIIYFV